MTDSELHAYRDGPDFVIQTEVTATEWIASDYTVEVRQ